jgi:hypothetical protein
MPGAYNLFAKNKVKTWSLVLLRRRGPHYTTSSCKNISRPSNYSDFIAAAPTAYVLALGYVGVQDYSECTECRALQIDGYIVRTTCIIGDIYLVSLCKTDYQHVSLCCFMLNCKLIQFQSSCYISQNNLLSLTLQNSL